MFIYGRYANAKKDWERPRAFGEIKRAIKIARDHGLKVNAGHGLDYNNVRDVARIGGIEELNIGHSIISRAVFVGLDRAVKEMLALIR